MDISVIGCGRTGATQAVCMAQLGHRVVGYDTDRTRIDLLRQGKDPFPEPGFKGMLQGSLSQRDIDFTNKERDLRQAHVHFICVDVFRDDDSFADILARAEEIVDELLPTLCMPGHARDVVAWRSALPKGTANFIRSFVKLMAPTVSVILNPVLHQTENTIEDILHPRYIVYGIDDPERDGEALRVLMKVYEATGSDQSITDYETAEILKLKESDFLNREVRIERNYPYAYCNSA